MSGPTRDIFVSHDHGDRELADRLCRALTAAGVTVWIDNREITGGERWAAELEAGLQSCRAFGLVATRAALASKWVETEYLAAVDLANAADSQLALIPLLFEDVKLPLLLRSFQWVDFRAGFDASVGELRRAIAALQAKAGTLAPQAPAVAFDERAAAAAEIDAKLRYVQMELRRERQKIRQLQIVRIAALVAGLLIGMFLASTGLAGSAWSGVALAVAVVLTIGCIGWGATFHQISAAEDRIAKLQLLDEGLRDCRERRSPVCREWGIEFWRVLHGPTAAAA